MKKLHKKCDIFGECSDPRGKIIKNFILKPPPFSRVFYNFSSSEYHNNISLVLSACGLTTLSQKLTDAICKRNFGHVEKLENNSAPTHFFRRDVCSMKTRVQNLKSRWAWTSVWTWRFNLYFEFLKQWIKSLSENKAPSSILWSCIYIPGNI